MYYPLFPDRQKINLDGIWNFCFLDEIALEHVHLENVIFNDLMCIPGTFDSLPKYFCRRGTGIYRREFKLQNSCHNLILKLGGLGLRGRIWIDGLETGYCNLPYSGVEFETGGLTAGEHIIHVAIDNRLDAEKTKLFSPFYDFYAFGGIYRSIEISSAPNGFWFDRVQVRTVNYSRGEVSLHFKFNGNIPTKIPISIRFDTESKFKEIDFYPSRNNGELSLIVPHFKLWSPDTPNLHTVEVKTNCDWIIEQFGIREIATGNKCLLLNGKKILLKGFNRHESSPILGPASSEQLLLNDLQNLKALSCNFIRGSHYPQDQRFLALCDRLGFLVWEESLGWGNTPEQLADPEFIELQDKQTRLMVRNSINHPSVIIWAFLNEFNSQTEVGWNLAQHLVKAIKEEDNSRLVTFACNHTSDDRCSKLMDLVAFNTYPGWINTDYQEDPMTEISPCLDEIIAYFRNTAGNDIPIIISEIGTCAIYGQHDPANAQWTEEFQREYLLKVMNKVLATDELCGLTIWQMNDAKSFLRKGAEIRSKPMALNLAGVFDQFRRPKLAAMAIKDFYSKWHL